MRAAVLLVVGGCSDDSGATKGSVVESTTTVPAPSTTIDVGLPPVDPATVDATKIAVADPGISVWLSSALAITEVPEGSACSPTPPTMDPAVATKVIAFGDVVLSELLVNLDSALGGLQLACANSDNTAVANELADAKAAARAVAARIDELSR